MTGPSKVLVSGPLGEFTEGFVAELAGLGYSPRGSEAQLRLTSHLSRWLGAAPRWIKWVWPGVAS